MQQEIALPEIGTYRLRAVPPQQFELQQRRPNGEWRGISWCTSFEAAGIVLLRRAMAEQSIPCKTVDDLIIAVEEAKQEIVLMLRGEMAAAEQQ